MEIDNFIEFKSSPQIREKLAEYGISKSFKEGDIILKENSYINSIPIVKKTNTPFDAIYDIFPCFVVDNWEDITSEILQNNLYGFTQKMNEFHDLYPNFLTYPYDFCI